MTNCDADRVHRRSCERSGTDECRTCVLEGITGENFRESDWYELPHAAGEELRMRQVEFVSLHDGRIREKC